MEPAVQLVLPLLGEATGADDEATLQITRALLPDMQDAAIAAATGLAISEVALLRQQVSDSKGKQGLS